MCESSLFEKELLQARKAWSEASLAVAHALADYKQFSTSEVGPERKTPVMFQNAVNTWLAPAETPRPEAQVAKAPPRHAPPQLGPPPPHPPPPQPAGYALGGLLPPPPAQPPPAGYTLGGLLPPPQPQPKAAPLQLNYHQEEQEDMWEGPWA